jgi:CheY-like chemotaxis protein
VVCPFADGADALRLLEATAFDLIISDVDMAGVDGMELLLRIHQRGRHMPVVPYRLAKLQEDRAPVRGPPKS